MAFNGDPTERAERRHLILASAFFVLSLVALSIPSPAQQQIATVLRLTVLHPFVVMQRSVNGARLRAVENAQLRAQLDTLVALMSNTGSLAEENRRLRGLMQLGGRLGASYRSASVTRSGTPGSESVFVIDLGARDGVRPGAPVLMRDGLVGKVIDVRRSESSAMDWTHPDFRASAMTAEGAAYGIVEPDRGSFREEDRLLLNGIAFFTELDPGTAVVTSGRGGVFPRGVPIGTIVELNEADARWRRSYWLRPAAEPASALHVLVAVEGGFARTDLGRAFSDDSGPESRAPLGSDTTDPGPDNEQSAAERMRPVPLAPTSDSTGGGAL
jgi:rod shape-determining protein MreC